MRRREIDIPAAGRPVSAVYGGRSGYVRDLVAHVSNTGESVQAGTLEGVSMSGVWRGRLPNIWALNE